MALLRIDKNTSWRNNIWSREKNYKKICIQCNSKKKKQNRIQLVKVAVYFFISLWHGFDLCVFEARENVFTEVFLVFYDKRLSIESTGTIAYRWWIEFFTCNIENWLTESMTFLITENNSFFFFLLCYSTNNICILNKFNTNLKF